jgi:glycosyltransferase involved in cell wall biosynthesis
MPTPISAIVITKNEQDMLAECLASISWADELLVVDSFSTDSTMEIAQRLATRAIQHPFQDFADQRNFAQDQAKYNWVLFVDADERVSPELREAICQLARTGQLAQFNGYYLHRVQLFSGRWWPDPNKPFMPADQLAIEYYSKQGHVRMLDRRLGKWERPLHEIARIPKPHGLVRGVLYHYSTSNLSLAYEPLNRYSDIEAAHLHQSRSRASLIEAVLRGIRSFIYHYFLGGLYRYGEPGFLIAVTNGYTKFMTYAKLSERLRIQNGHGVWTERDRQLLDQSPAEQNSPASRDAKSDEA